MKIIFVSIIFFVLFQSCEKEYSFEGRPLTADTLLTATPVIDTALKDTSFLVRRYTEKRGNNFQEYNFSYDSQDRLVSKISVSGTSQFIYQYNTNNTFTVDFFNGSLLSTRELYYINNFNLVDSLVRIDYGTKDTTSEKYIYNVNKQLVQEKEYDIVNFHPVLTNNTTAEYDSNGNVTREYNTYGNIITYQYTSFPYNLDIGLNYFSRNKNLIQTSTYTGSTNVVLKYSYNFDNYKRLISETVTDTNGNIIVIKTYGY
jgi:hypothetical protein